VRLTGHVDANVRDVNKLVVFILALLSWLFATRKLVTATQALLAL
jgi:hypothetical protein